MKVLYIYSDKTGLSRSKKKDARLITKIKKIYDDLTILKTSTLDEFKIAIESSIDNFDILLVTGGDGTLKFVVNVLMTFPKEKRPLLGYLPGGTINDAGKAFGCGNTLRKGLRNLKKGKTTQIDVVKVNNEYINFVIANGAFADISYSTHRTGKKIIGRLAYYFDAIPRVFKKRIVNATIDADGKIYKVKAPFIMLLNSKNVGGFPVNFKYSVQDGLIELYFTKPGLANGLLHFLFFRVKTTCIRAKHIKITTDLKTPWCLDGEEGFAGDIEISVLKQELSVIGTAK